jgi:tetratricopeptide (TPR) repeat protein
VTEDNKAFEIEPGSAEAHIKVGNDHRAQGNLDDAMVCYMRALEVEPGNAGAHLNIGNVLRVRGRLDDAIAHFNEALGIEPDNAGAHINLGNVLQAQGKIDDAVAHYRKALDLEPANAGTHINLGNILQARGKFDDAIAHYQAALEIGPDLAVACINLGNVLQARGKFEDAIAAYQRAIQIDPRQAVVYNNLGGAILGARGRLEDAAACFEQALALKPDYADAHHNLANILRAQGRLDDAVASYQRALAFRPDRHDILNKLGSTLKDQGKLDDAIACYGRALALQPNYAEAHYNLGNAFRAQGRLDDALGCYERALALKPDYADAHANLILTLQDQGRLGDALACCNRALTFYPDSAETHFSEAYIRLLSGDFGEGWRKYEWRWLTKDAKPHGLTAPLWDGTDLRGRTILLHCEQGLGDAIQCVRFARLVKEQNGIVLLSCPPSLARLFKDVAGVDGIFPDSRGLPDYDVHAPMMSLPGLFRTTLENIPAGVPYLQSDPTRADLWKDRLAGYRGFRVGIVWRGSAANRNDRKRSMTAAQFAEFLDIPGLAVISLQKDGTAEEMEKLGHIPGPFLDTGPLQEDFRDAAALMANLDLVVSVDTSVCHLAGALAVPVWTLIPFVPDWRWLLQREDSPWYPSMRLFRQPKIGDWRSVLDRVRAELARMVETV